MAPLRVNKSVTLLELLIAIVLFSAVVLTFASIDLFSRRQLLSSERQIKLQNEASTLVAHMSKNIQKAVGTCVDFPININDAASGGPLMTIYLDSTGDGLRDKQVAYQWIKADYTVKYYDNYGASLASSEIIATKIKSCIMTAATTLNYVQLTIVACWNPSQAPSYYTNPCVTMVTRVTMSSVSTH